MAGPSDFSKKPIIRFIVDSAKARSEIKRLQNELNNLKIGMKGFDKRGIIKGTMIHSVLPPNMLNEMKMFQRHLGKNQNSIDTAKIATTKWGTVLGNTSTMLGGALYRFRSFLELIKSLPPHIKAVSAALIGVGFTLKKMVEHGVTAEGSIITMTTLIGRQTDALRIYKDALRFAGRTPFDPGVVGAAAGRAVQYGITDPFKNALQGAKGKISAMDIFSSLGSFTDMEGRMIGIGRAMQGIMTGNLKMTRAFRAVIGEAWEATKKVAKVGSKEWGTKILENIAKIPKVMDLAKMRADSVVGAWSTIKGYAAEFFITMSGVHSAAQFTFWKQLNKLLLSIRDTIRKFLDDNEMFFDRLGSWIGATFTFLVDIFKIIWTFLGPIVDWIWTIGKGILMVVLETMITIFRLLFKILEKTLGLVYDLLMNIPIVSDILRFLLEGTKGITTWLRDFVTWLQISYIFLSSMIDALFSTKRIYDFVNSLINGVRNFLLMIEKGVEYVIWSINNGITKMAKQIEVVWATIRHGAGSKELAQANREMEEQKKKTFQSYWAERGTRQEMTGAVMSLAKEPVQTRDVLTKNITTTNNRNKTVDRSQVTNKFYQVGPHEYEEIIEENYSGE